VPISGFTGTLAPESSVEKFYSDVHTILEKTTDGIDHLINAPKGGEVHQGSASLESLPPGTPVVVHYTVKGIQTSPDERDRLGLEGTTHNEGTVTAVDPAKRALTIQFTDGATETLRLAHHVDVSNSHTLGDSRAVVYSTDSSGRTIARYFKPAKR